MAHPQQRVTRCVISKTDAALTSLLRPPTQMMLTLGLGDHYARRSDASHLPITERIIAEAGVYYTRELGIFPVDSNEKSPCDNT